MNTTKVWLYYALKIAPKIEILLCTTSLRMLKWSVIIIGESTTTAILACLVYRYKVKAKLIKTNVEAISKNWGLHLALVSNTFNHRKWEGWKRFYCFYNHCVTLEQIKKSLLMDILKSILSGNNYWPCAVWVLVNSRVGLQKFTWKMEMLIK